ncbi:DUF3336 domain-containing protein [Acinetobacter rathckeae]|uniref:DUF3336 domain-containing protein n=1 Tax=Acinetobacter rathckeae TaxID=2605272 RepID=UPI0018A2A144|nr:DUF3336 domain-containing protein [Acinetobacter rathckeae]MBF7687598.1 DUF3336 domain-containing protein [Acinetobacter rathckeae]MBF7695000.1 DUF3336 domain-containing protein [Acinetobacter rathckeae]
MLDLISKHTSNIQQTFKIKKLEHQLAKAENYAQWQQIAFELDQCTDALAWKHDLQSSYFTVDLILNRLNTLRQYRTQHDIPAMIHLLREGLSYDIANICHPMLFSVIRLGTKQIIEDYVAEVSECLSDISQLPNVEMSLEQKLKFFNRCQTAYGQPALMFSGGATLGLFHSGVCKALKEQDLLPNVLSGASAGAVMASLLGSIDADQLDILTQSDNLFSDVFQFKSFKMLLKEPTGFTSNEALKKFLIAHLGDLTFAEAYEKSGLHLNIAVAPYDATQKPQLLNQYTSPDVLIWSAVLASCAVPILFSPVKLLAKCENGQHVPFLGDTQWVDGSVRSDFPQEKMARLYNMNYSIASQANPHVVPFMQTDVERYRQDLLSWPEKIVRRQGKLLAKGVMDFTRERVGAVPQVRRLLDHGYGIVDQHYYGDINIIGQYSLRHYTYLLQNPTPEIFKKLQLEGERATWPKLSMIEMHARVGKTIEHILTDLKKQQNTS